MSRRPYVILEETRAAQARAADPSASAWVSAHAGSGKTHVLANRVIRLLLDGTDPSRILCLTYTRAAAGEMKARIFKVLGGWALAEDAELAAAIGELAGGSVTTARIAAARRLFAQALETPGGLKIQTIHAFCEAVLKRFPLEANIAGHFEMLDDSAAEVLIAEARRALLSGRDEGGRPALTGALAHVLDRVGEFGLDALLSAIVALRDPLRGFITALDGAGDWTELFAEFGFATTDGEAGIVAGLWPDSGLGTGFATTLLAAARAAGVKTATGLAESLVAAEAETVPLRRFRLLESAFLKKDGGPRKPADFLPKAITGQFPGADERLERKAGEIAAAADRLATLNMVRDTAAMLSLADALIARYERAKAARGLLDFNDLIHRTLALLSRAEAAEWIRYKLDQGIDHLLVDEAQDTSPAQWRVIAGIVSDFFAGEGAREGVRRTIFAVGDEKQSIYSFQGADPAAFVLERETYRARAGGGAAAFEVVKLQQSFRSTEDVLRLVDEVFADPEARAGLTRDPEPVMHASVRAGAPGLVELWPSLGADAVEEPEDWTEAIDHAQAPAVKLAQAIAATIGGWIAAGETVEGKAGVRRPMRPGDVIVLVRKRDRFMHALSRALKELRPTAVPAAGVDRLRLSAHIAVKDMIALGRVCLQPHDDLSLAALLKSPVFGLEEDALFALAHGRTGSLMEALREKATDELKLRRALERLDRWRGEIDVKPPFEFYAAVLGRDGVRRAMAARLGPEAAEILDEFLAYALAAEQAGPPGMEAFLAVLETAAPEIKREAPEGRDEVRIMTAHASKGLEAPVVFLVDPGSAPAHGSHLPILMPFSSPRWPGGGFVWRSGKETQNNWRRAREAERKMAAEDEYRRLLYVGLTRAEDRLVICGYHGRNEPEGRWHVLVSRAFARLGAQVTSRDEPLLGGTIQQFSLSPGQVPAPVVSRREESRPRDLPAWLVRPLAPEPAPPRPLAPSGAALVSEASQAGVGPAGSPVFAPTGEPALAIRRGQAIHRLLQILPGLDSAVRGEAAARYLDRVAADWTAGERSRTRDTVLDVLADPAFSPVFVPGSRAEVAIQGAIAIGGRERMIVGKVDRLAVGDDVLFVDYKTTRPVPAGAGDVPDDHVIQLALYRCLLAAIFPGKTVRAGLLYVEVPRLIEVGEAALDAAFGRLDAALRTP